MPLLPKQKIKKQSKIASFFSHFKKPSPRKVVVFVLFLSIISVPLLHLSTVHAQDYPDPHADPNYTLGAGLRGAAHALAYLGAYIIMPVLAIIAYALKELVGYAGQMLDATLSPDLYNFANNEMINTGWTMVRDVCNMFFLLILLFIAFCTILQIDKYHAKKTLLTLILMALLINFSRPIAVFVFDGSQLLMNHFLKLLTGGAQKPSVMYTNAIEIANIIYNKIPSIWGRNSIDLAVQYIFAILFIFMLMVAYFVIAIFLIIRIIAIMVLIIVAPVAFLATAIPDFKHISSSWWNALFKYAYYGPAAAFFLYLATKLSTSLYFLDKGVKQGTDSLVVMILHYATVLVFLYASIIMAQKFGIAFAGAVTGWGNRVLKRGLTGGYFRDLGRGVRGLYRASGVHEPMKEKLKESYPRFHSWVTKEGREKKKKELWEEKVFPTKKGEQRAVAVAQKEMREANFTEADYANTMKDSRSRKSQRIAAALALAEAGKLNLAQYKQAQADIGDNKAFQKQFEGETLKKNLHTVISYDIETKEKTKGAKLTGMEINDVLKKRLSKANPEQLAKHQLSKIRRLEKARGGDFLENMVIDMATDPNPQRFNKFIAELSETERVTLKKMGLI